MLNRLKHRLLTVLRPPRAPECFDPQWYLATQEDVAAAGMDPRRHYLRYGQAEGRPPCFLPAIQRERDLRWGLLEDGEAALRAMAVDPAGGAADRLWARLACARAAARRGDWDDAADWLAPLDPQRDLVDAFRLPGPMLLAIEVAVVTGHADRARDLAKRAMAAFGPLPDLQLAGANARAAAEGFGPGWQAALAGMYRARGLCGIALAPADDAALAPFDRLRPDGSCRTEGRGGPLVSVVMPARDAGDTIGTALRSLSGQTWRALEVLVVDNGSRDDTAAVVRRMAARDPRIRLLDGSAEPGAYAARNLGIEAARGAFVTVLDADDWAHPQRIARQVRTLRRAPGRVVASLAHWVRTTPDLRFTGWWRDAGLVHPDISSLMVRAGARARLGFWDRVRVGADTEYMDRIAALFGPDAIRETCAGVPLGLGRLRGESLTGSAETSIASHLFGDRRNYAEAGRRWHARMQEGGDLPLPRRPARRPFPAPAALEIIPADPPPAPDPVETMAGDELFDAAWYMQTYADLRTGTPDPVQHYATEGEAEGRNPGPAFAASAYRLAHGPFQGSALTHYRETGRAAGLSPLPVFDGALPAPVPGRHLLVFGHQAGASIFGAERSLLDLLDRAREAGCTPSVVLPQCQNAAYLADLRARAHAVHVVPYGWLSGGIAPPAATLERLNALIRETGAADVIQNCGVMDAPLRAARAAGVPSAVYLHELPAEDPMLCQGLGLGAPALRGHLLDHADRFLAVSPAVADWMDAPPGRLTLLPNRIDPALSEMPFTPESPLRVALIGNLVAKKGLADTLAVARLAQKAGLPLRFVLVGPQTAELSRAGPLPRNTVHAGYAPGPAAAIAQADVVLSLSRVAESFGRTVLEALAAGRPVVCYDRGTPPALVGRDGAAGQVVPADDPAAVLEALRGMSADPALLQRMSAAARDRARHHRDAAERPGDAPAFACAGPRP